MKFNHLKTDKCPSCGCDVVVQESVQAWNGEITKHCNGQRWESRHFLCGSRVNWVPNFSAEKISGQCTNTDEYREHEAMRAEIRKDIKILEHKLALLWTA